MMGLSASEDIEKDMYMGEFVVEIINYDIA
jgi:hypothetical protein